MRVSIVQKIYSYWEKKKGLLLVSGPIALFARCALKAT